MSDIQTETITLEVSDGTQMRAYVARPTKPGPGLMVLQEAFGVNHHIRDVTERFAREGYLAIAPELFHRTAPGFEGKYDDFPSVMGHMQALTDESMAADLVAAHGWLAAQGVAKSAAIGYCMGGRAAFLTALSTPVNCAISYYGGGIAPGPRGPGLLGRVDEVNCPLLFFWGGLDQHIGPDAVRAVEDALTGAGKDFINTVVSKADHGFFCNERPMFNPTASAEAWAFTLAFLRENVG